MKEINRFIRWARRNCYGRGLVCHFYRDKSTQQFYTTTDYAYFNFFSGISDWIVKGTIKHGVPSPRGKRSRIPCLNLYKLDDAFYEALRILSRTEKLAKYYALGVIFSKLALKRHFGEKSVIDVGEIDRWDPLPPPSKSHCFDFRQDRKRLYPFKNCGVVRLTIKPSRYLEMPITRIPSRAIKGIIVRRKEHLDIEKILESSKSLEKEDINLFALL